ncbi:hypothetical protein chiPu_0027062, partial [Chiloscyllium punctatum]|nr:hypothetical protein [Chiloscyllium punctatum]
PPHVFPWQIQRRLEAEKLRFAEERRLVKMVGLDVARHEADKKKSVSAQG